MNNLTIAIDIGNTVTHFGLIDTQRLTCIVSTKCPTDSAAIQSSGCLNELFTKADCLLPFPCKISSVANSRTDEIIRAVKSTGKLQSLDLVSCHSNLPVRLTYNPHDSLGTDRVANCLFAKALLPGHNVVIIDAGTAVTVDIITLEGIFIGGAIIPGIKTQLRALHKNTERLPDISELNATAGFPATDTESCMTGGIIIGLAGALDSFVNISRKLCGTVEILTCGGGWPVLERFVTFPFRHEPDCTLIGTALYND